MKIYLSLVFLGGKLILLVIKLLEFGFKEVIKLR